MRSKVPVFRVDIFATVPPIRRVMGIGEKMEVSMGYCDVCQSAGSVN
jgi:hypothetical protein